MSVAVLSFHSSSSLRTEVVDAQAAGAQVARTLRGQHAPAGDRNSRTVSKWPALGQDSSCANSNRAAHPATTNATRRRGRRNEGHPCTRNVVSLRW